MIMQCAFALIKGEEHIGSGVFQRSLLKFKTGFFYIL